MSEDYAEYPTEYPTEYSPEYPVDISKSGIKAIRRLQALAANHLHIFALLKFANQWFLFCITGKGIKMERLS